MLLRAPEIKLQREVCDLLGFPAVVLYLVLGTHRLHPLQGTKSNVPLELKGLPIVKHPR